MQFYVRNAVGFEINFSIAEKIGLGDDFDRPYFDEALKEKFKIKPHAQIQKFVYERGGEVQGLEGFEYGKTYCWFFQDEAKGRGWKKFIKALEDNGISMIEGYWSQLG